MFYIIGQLILSFLLIGFFMPCLGFEYAFGIGLLYGCLALFAPDLFGMPTDEKKDE
jgi:hypothetical protein